jgi:hypothetical protein
MTPSQMAVEPTVPSLCDEQPSAALERYPSAS